MTSCETSHPEFPYPKSSLTTFAQQQDGIHYKAESTWSDGRSTAVEVLFKMDGSWCPLVGSALADSVSLRSLDDGSFEGTMKKGGIESGKNRMRVSADGQRMNTEWHIADPGGVTITWKTTSQRV